MVIKTKTFIICLIGSLIWMLGIGITSVSAMETEDCLGCHGDSSIVEEGGKRLYIDGTKFAATAHAEEGCTACHSITDEHPDDGVKPTTGTCDMCHDDIAGEYAKCPHAKNAVCIDCHNPHTVRPYPALSGFDQNRPCAKCHEQVGHSQWLPRAGLHMEAVPCITCHTNTKNCAITFYIEKTKGPKAGKRGIIELATYKDLTQFIGKKGPQALIDTNGDGTISMVELRKFNTNSGYKGLRLWGMMTAEKVSHSFGIFDNRKDCSFCHVAGPKALETSYVAFPKQDGTYTRLTVEKGAVLNPLLATPNFYMVGAGRNNILSIIGLLILAGGLGAVFLHGTFRFLTRKNRRKN